MGMIGPPPASPPRAMPGGGRPRSPRPLGADRLILALVLVVVAALAIVLPAGRAAAGTSPLVSFAAQSRLVHPASGASAGAIARIDLVVSRPVLGQAQVLTWDGQFVREILHPSQRPTGTTRLTWNGAGPDGSPAPDGPYRVRLTLTDADGAVTTAEARVSKVSSPAYPLAPSAVTVFLDPGHGGPETGTTGVLPDGSTLRESDVDLDIALRLAAMLRDSGIRVSMSRTTDAAANRAGVDRNHDGRVDGYDEFLARTDAANAVRADLFIAVHNNWLPREEGRTEAFFCGRGCSWPQASKSLAGDILQAHVARLTPLQTDTWQLTVGDPAIPEAVRNPTDDYIHFEAATLVTGRHFYVLGPYDAAFRPRPIEMPGALVESLAFSNPHELQLLAEGSTRTLLASAYYDGITAFLADRPYALRLDPAGPPGPVSAPRVGVRTSVRVRVTNNGTRPIPAGLRLSVGAVPLAVPFDGSPSRGRQIGSAIVPTAIAPGRSATVAVVVVPLSAGRQTWKVDGVQAGVWTSSRGVPFLQFRVSVAR
jgi:N-acetylmuramoyl-L-alanine amidase